MQEKECLENKTSKIDKKCLQFFSLPKAVYFIIVTEFCERFTYYGMRTILILYLTQHLLLHANDAVSIYHFFVSICYFTTILGSFISDNYLGKYKTLVITGTIYTIGCAIMSLTSIPIRNLYGPLIGLILIAFGTGGVKACVGPFGADQIPSKKKMILDSYFSTFYFAINIGALLSTFIMPMLRTEVACNGSKDCYPLAFGTPAILMAIALNDNADDEDHVHDSQITLAKRNHKYLNLRSVEFDTDTNIRCNRKKTERKPLKKLKFKLPKFSKVKAATKSDENSKF